MDLLMSDLVEKRKSALGADLLAGITVAIVALPLAMAFAIASGLQPHHGLFTAIVAGFLISAFGGSRCQIGGPTGAFVVIVYGIVSEHGYEGLVIATIMAGVILLALGMFKFGTLIQYIPYPVTTGFTSGIALLIFSGQIKDMLGLDINNLPPEFISQAVIYIRSGGDIDGATLLLGFCCVTGLLAQRRVFPTIPIPAPFLIVVVSSVIVYIFDIQVATIGTRFGTIPDTLPMPSLPTINGDLLKELFPSAMTIALLGAIESLMSAVVADGMTGDRHEPNRELTAQGLANIISPLFGGMPATGAIARTATNIKAGARTSSAGMIHAIILAMFMYFFAGLIVHIPMVALASVLIVVALNMADIREFMRLLKAPRSDALVLVATFLLTVLIDLSVAVQTGVALSGLLFIRRMSEVTELSVVDHRLAEVLHGNGPQAGMGVSGDVADLSSHSIVTYEINGPFFFGVADRMVSSLHSIGDRPGVLILRLRYVPIIDATGMHALEKIHEECKRNGTTLVLSGVAPRLHDVLSHYGFCKEIGEENVTSRIENATARAIQICNEQTNG